MKQFFTSLIKESASENENTIMEFVVYSLNTISQFHLYHFLTKNAQQHDAIGQFYNSLNDEIDNFTEYFLGENNISTYISQNSYNFQTISTIENIVSSLNEYDAKLLNIRAILDVNKEGSLVDSVDDIKELVSKLKYKLKMV